ncbi:MAG: S1C family serine protease [Actinobacteria bacterium]|nr:S1C family serine protease [Actinomycetota bacterium]
MYRNRTQRRADRRNHSSRPTTQTTARTSAARSLTVVPILGIALLAGACGSDVTASDLRDLTSTTTAEAPTTTALPPVSLPVATVSTVPASTVAVSSLDSVQGATVQIVAQGTFVDPEFGAYESVGRGSGFVVDPSGIAVTNHHVVGGAGLIQVYVQGEDEPRNAKVLGVSECSDLAVIDIEGDPLPALSWYTGPVQPGLEIYAAGYPLGDPEFTLTRGIVSKADAPGETQWASIDHAIEHDANTQPGNSGGPLVSADGEVVAINYASGSSTNTDQFFSIEASDAAGIIAEMMAGNDVDSLGVNGQIVMSDDGTIAGLWVSGVDSGSPADDTGIEPGDIITRIEGVSVGTDGTMADYCDVMRTHNPGDVLSVEVLRFATEEVLTGQFNGEYLTTAFSFAETVDTGIDAGAEYTDYTTVTDDSGTLTVSVPTAWSSIDGAPVDIDGVSSPSIIASTDVAAYNSAWDVPGVQFVASAALTGFTADELLDLGATTECTFEGREDYDDGAFVGRFDTYSNCGGTGATSIVVAAFPADGSYGVLVVVQVVTDADLVALDEIIRTFNVVA